MDDIHVLRIKLKDESLLLEKLIKAKQHIYNCLVIVWKNTTDKNIKSYIRSYSVIRKMLSSNIDDNKSSYLKNYLSINYPTILTSLEEFYSTYSNKIIVDIVKEFNVSVKNNLIKSKQTKKPFNLKTKKLSKIKSGNIDMNSNIVKLYGNIIDIQIFTKKYKTLNKLKDNFKYYISNKIIDKIKEIKNINFVKRYNDYYLMITYTSNKKYNSINGNYCLGIDIGMKNHFTITSTNELSPSLIIKNRAINRINRTYFNVISKVQGKKDILKNNRDFGIEYNNLTNIIDRFNHKRSIIINQEFNKITNRIIDYCRKFSISKIVYGLNKGLKNKLNLGKNNNKNFYVIPHYQFKELLKWKSSLYGIEFIEQEESYTSKFNCILKGFNIWKYYYPDFKPTDTVLKLQGVRGTKYRNIFKYKNYKFHADVNGSFNIIKKYLKEDFDIYHHQLFNPILIKDDFNFLNIVR